MCINFMTQSVGMKWTVESAVGIQSASLYSLTPTFPNTVFDNRKLCLAKYQYL
jgi:hypothetical protein